MPLMAFVIFKRRVVVWRTPCILHPSSFHPVLYTFQLSSFRYNSQSLHYYAGRGFAVVCRRGCLWSMCNRLLLLLIQSFVINSSRDIDPPRLRVDGEGGGQSCCKALLLLVLRSSPSVRGVYNTHISRGPIIYIRTTISDIWRDLYKYT